MRMRVGSSGGLRQQSCRVFPFIRVNAVGQNADFNRDGAGGRGLPPVRYVAGGIEFITGVHVSTIVDFQQLRDESSGEI